ncbi:MAG: hypothetical protein M3Y27_04360 [Acidobacteriota bacterium]|nr:hypothetical protein [Acidobacteriota bacterium]
MPTGVYTGMWWYTKFPEPAIATFQCGDRRPKHRVAWQTAKGDRPPYRYDYKILDTLHITHH